MNELELLEKQAAAIKTKIELITSTTNKWSPQSGDYWVGGDGRVTQGLTSDSTRLFGAERPSKELAYTAANHLRKFSLLLAYRDEYCPYYTFVTSKPNFSVFYDHSLEKWTYKSTVDEESIEVYFTKDVAVSLVEKLNTGVVVL